MREIKFRAWFRRESRWLNDHEYKIIPNGQISTMGVFPSSTDISLMQFTGLKDKSGKEIYEGDVILFSDERWEIVYAECGFFITQKGKISQWLALVLNKSEVIGNIYENKELLERGEV
jgi:uncharacterized phage protein (TIGR01671 family)